MICGLMALQRSGKYPIRVITIVCHVIGPTMNTLRGFKAKRISKSSAG